MFLFSLLVITAILVDINLFLYCEMFVFHITFIQIIKKNLRRNSFGETNHIFPYDFGTRFLAHLR